jgi:hypothetical protein
MKTRVRFSKKLAKEIAESAFGLVLDCVLGYSDSEYNMSTEAHSFEQFFEGELDEKDVVITTYKVKVISEYYEKMRLDFIDKTRKKYYTNNG